MQLFVLNLVCDFFVLNMACDCSQALNEVVVDRGDASYLCQLDLYIEDKQVTVVQGDGWYFWFFKYDSVIFLIML